MSHLPSGLVMAGRRGYARWLGPFPLDIHAVVQGKDYRRTHRSLLLRLPGELCKALFGRYPLLSAPSTPSGGHGCVDMVG